jgi:hypothetical protein
MAERCTSVYQVGRSIIPLYRAIAVPVGYKIYGRTDIGMCAVCSSLPYFDIERYPIGTTDTRHERRIVKYCYECLQDEFDSE